MTTKPQAKKEVPLKNNQSEVAVYELLPDHTSAMQGKLSHEHQMELDDALKIASIVLSGRSVEAALMQVRENVKVVFKNDADNNSLNAAINKKFIAYLGEEHLENIDFMQEISKDGVGTFVVHISKLGLTELGRRTVAGMLNGTIPKPVEYKDRSPVNGKREKILEFFSAKFGELVRVNAIYAHELRKLNPSLYKNIAGTIKGGISSLMLTKSDKVSSDIASLANHHSVAHNVLRSAYARN